MLFQVFALPQFQRQAEVVKSAILGLCDWQLVSKQEQEAVNVWVLDLQTETRWQTIEWAQESLNAMRNQADIIVLFESQIVDMSQQLFWSEWLADSAGKFLVLRANAQGLSDNSQQILAKLKPEKFRVSRAPFAKSELEVIEIPAKTVHLEHLMMAMSNAIESMGMKIHRVSGVFKVTEFAHPVLIDWSAFLWQTERAEEDALQSTIRISGEQLDAEWFQQIIDSCQF